MITIDFLKRTRLDLPCIVAAEQGAHHASAFVGVRIGRHSFLLCSKLARRWYDCTINRWVPNTGTTHLQVAEYAFCNNPTECQGYECSHSLSSNEQGTDRASSLPRQLCYSRPKVLSWSQTETKNGSHQAKAFREANAPIVSDGETC